VSETELSVVCKNCSSEVSPYVTECPYCGARLRKRAPKLERRGDGIEAKPKRLGRRRPRIGRGPSDALAAERPVVTIAFIAAPAILLLVQIASDRPTTDFGAIAGEVGSEWWRYLAAPFVYLDIGYLFVVGLALAIFGTGIERRLGSIPALILLVACGALGMLAADAVENARNGFALIAGGNGIALGAIGAWLALRRAEARRLPEDDVDAIAVAVAAAVVLLLPLVEDWANVFAGLGGGAVGALAGTAAASMRPSA
jgi:membrane associated rhomboid family serine protease